MLVNDPDNLADTVIIAPCLLKLDPMMLHAGRGIIERDDRDLHRDSGRGEAESLDQEVERPRPSASADERDQRRRRLTRGPSEFREHRVDLPKAKK